MAQGNDDLFRALEAIDPKRPYGTELFDALARLTVSVAVEAVCLRLAKGSQISEVYLVKRSPDDTAYPGQWHCPGSFLRPGEEMCHVFDRLSRREFKGVITPLQFVANVNHPTEARGHVVSVVYLCSLEEGGLQGRWFPVNQLPEKTVEVHRARIIPAALGIFVAENSKICRKIGLRRT